MTLVWNNVTIAGDGTATWTGNAPNWIGNQPVWSPPRAPAIGLAGSEKPEVTVHAFGDGYERREARGLNHLTLQKTIAFDKVTTAEKDQIVQFLRARGGIQPFWWQQPNDAMRRWVALEWSEVQDFWDAWTITVRLKRDYTPII